MTHDSLQQSETHRSRFGLGITVATVLAAVAIALLVALEAPAPTPSLGSPVRVDEPACDRQSVCLNHSPRRSEARQSPVRTSPGERCQVGEPAEAPSEGATPVLPPGDEDAGDDEDDDRDTDSEEDDEDLDGDG